MPKERSFNDKFRLLNSQEHSDDIKWSTSSSSDYENTSGNDKVCILEKTRNRKRKRKKKVLKNISNLDITILDTSKENRPNRNREKSPILITKSVTKPTSPILSSSRLPPKIDSSPILIAKSIQIKSPILTQKSLSPKYTAKVKKKLCYNGMNTEDRASYQGSSCKLANMEVLDNRKSTNSIENEDHFTQKSDIKIKLLDKSISPVSAKMDLMKKVKNFFDNQFSSDNNSQNISDTPTPEDSKMLELNQTIEILTCRTQNMPNIQLIKQESSNSDCSNYFEKNNKKIRYKKGGLAYRLNCLLKKQNAHVSLWQHERFLAVNSNFVIPKGEHIVFYIRNVEFKYGCYLLQATDTKNEAYFIMINRCYVNNNLNDDSVFKLYEPYRVLDLNEDYKIIVNVCKFECIDFKKCIE